MVVLFTRLTSLAVGVATSPLLIVALLVVLLSRRALAGGLALAISWVAGVLSAIGVSILLAGRIHAPQIGAGIRADGLFTLAFGAALVAVAVWARRRRMRVADPEPPAWVRSVDRISPAGAAALAFTHATTSPKNLALAIAAGKAVVDARLSLGQSSAAVLYYTTIASIGVAVPMVLYLAGGVRSTAVLQRWRERVTANANAVIEIMVFVFGLALSVRGIIELLS